MRSTRVLSRSFVILIFILSAVGVGYCYAALQAREQDSYLISEPFTLGESKVQILFNNQCFGEFNLKFIADGDTHSFNGDGSLSFAVGGKSYSPHIQVEAAFNELDQMGGSVFKVDLPDLKFNFGTVGIDPLEFRFRLLQEQDKKLTFKIPGPIELRKFSNAKYALRYGFLSQIKGGLPNMDLGLSFRVVKDQKCNLDQKNPPNLTPLILKALQMTSKANYKQPLPLFPGVSSFENF